MKIGCIGLGQMGATLARIIAKSQPSQDLLLANRSPQKAIDLAQEIGGRAVDNEGVFREADVIVLGVKPHQFADLLTQFAFILEERPSLLLVSMAAGLDLASLGRLTAAKHRWLRIMPNTPLAVGQGVVTYAGDAKVTQSDESLLKDCLSQAAQVVKLEEGQLDAATALAGCGAAFVYQFIVALCDGGVKNGLPRDLALRLASQTVMGAAKMVLETDQHPAVLKDQVCSPGGSTIAGVASLESSAFRGATIAALDAAYRRTQALGKK